MKTARETLEIMKARTKAKDKLRRLYDAYRVRYFRNLEAVDAKFPT